MTRLIEYIAAGILAVSPLIMATAQQCNPAEEPQLILSYDLNAMIWSYPEEYQARNFKDERPFGSLDEVVIRNNAGKVTILKQGDSGFKEQEEIYLKQVFPNYPNNL